MSLLLDALKKSGHYQNVAKDGAGNGTPSSPGLTLEEIPPAAAASTPAHTRTDATRAAGENLFAAKKKPTKTRGRVRLGIVPIALIAGSLFAAGYGYYVYREISGLAARPAPARQPATAAPVAATPSPATPALMPLAQAPRAAEPPTVFAPAPKAAAKAELQPRSVRAPRAPALQIEKKETTDPITLLLQGAYAAYRQGDFDTAQQKYQAALHQDPRNHDALLGMAAITQERGQDTVASDYYGRLLELDPRDPAAQAGISALGKEGATSKESRLKQMIDQQPQSAALHFALGNLYAEQSRWAESQQAYFNAYSLQPDAAQYAFNLAISLDHLGQQKPAAQYYQRALQLDGASSTFDHAQAEKRLNELRVP